MNPVSFFFIILHICLETHTKAPENVAPVSAADRYSVLTLTRLWGTNQYCAGNVGYFNIIHDIVTSYNDV